MQETNLRIGEFRRIQTARFISYVQRGEVAERSVILIFTCLTVKLQLGLSGISAVIMLGTIKNVREKYFNEAALSLSDNPGIHLLNFFSPFLQ